MNPKSMTETETIRSDIEMTRRRMDDTVEALGERLHGRHLLDEVIGFFRGGEDSSGTGARLREKITDSAGTAANTVVDTVKKNPLPILLLTAGAAWLAYSATKQRRSESEDSESESEDRYDPDTHYDRPLEYPGGSMAKMGDESASDSKLQRMKDTVQEKASAAKDQIKEKWSDLTGSTSDTLSSMRQRAGEITDQVQDRTREIYDHTRDRVAQATDEYPLQLGLGCLAVGTLIGLAIPTPAPVNRLAGPTVDRLRSRTREAGKEFVQKGKRVVQAASDAAKNEAESQGLSIDQLRRGGAQSGEQAGDGSVGETNPGPASGMSAGAENSSQASASPTDPSASGPSI